MRADPLRILILEDVPMDAELVEYELGRASVPFDARRVDTRDAFERQPALFMKGAPAMHQAARDGLESSFHRKLRSEGHGRGMRAEVEAPRRRRCRSQHRRGAATTRSARRPGQDRARFMNRAG